MDFYHNKLNAATILIRLQLLFYILLQLHICLRGSESGAIAAGNPNQEMDTYLVILSGSSVLHYDGSIPNFSIPPLRPDGRPDMLRYSSLIIYVHIMEFFMTTSQILLMNVAQ